MNTKWLPALVLLVWCGTVPALPVPMPKEYFFAGEVAVGLARPVGYTGEEAKFPAQLLARELSRWSGVTVTAQPGTGGFRLVLDRMLAPGHYTIEGETLTGGDERALFDAAQTLLGALAGPDAVWSEQAVSIPVLMIQDYSGIPWRAARWEGMASEPEGLRALARLKYNVLLMRQPDAEAVARAREFGLQVVPEVDDWAGAEAWMASGIPVREMYFAGDMAAEVPEIREFALRHRLDPLVGMAGAGADGLLAVVYDGDDDRRRFPELEQLHREGKRIVFAPRTPESARWMAKSAALYGAGVIAPAWDGTTVAGDTLVLLAEYGWNPANTRVPYAFPTLSIWYDLLYDRESRGGEFLPVALPVAAGEGGLELNYKGVPFRITEPLFLGGWPNGDFDGVLENELRARLPLAIGKDGETVTVIRNLNEAPVFDEWSLFTRNYGTSTRTDSDYGEVRIVAGNAEAVALPGAGDMRIPHRGAVLAARDWTPEWNVGDPVTVTGADGRPVEWYAASAMQPYPETAEVMLPEERISRLHFWHDTGVEALPGTVAEGEVVYADDSTASFSVEAPAMVAVSDGVAQAPMAWAAVTDGSDFNQDAVTYVYMWTNPSPEKPVRSLRLRIAPAGREAGYRLWALTMEK